MEAIFFNTKEVADFLNIHEKQVYALIKAKKIPCTRVTGKWLFPKAVLEEWITSDALKNVNAVHRAKDSFLLASGSNDPVLDVLLNSIKIDEDILPIYAVSTGSMDGLNRLSEKKTDIAFCHLYDHENDSFNIQIVDDYLQQSKFAIIHLFYRQIGFLVSPSVNEQVQQFHDIANNSFRFINRQQGAGTRLLIDHLLSQDSVKASDINGYNDEVFSHLEVALKILSGQSDIGVGTVAMAGLFNLNFIPLLKESFDMVMMQQTFFSSTVQSIIRHLTTDDFKASVKHLGDYDFTNSGAILHSS